MNSNRLKFMYHILYGATILGVCSVILTFMIFNFSYALYLALALIAGACLIMYLCFFCERQLYRMLTVCFGDKATDTIKIFRMILLAIDAVIVLCHAVVYIYFILSIHDLIPLKTGENMVMYIVIFLFLFGLPISLFLYVAEKLLCFFEKQKAKSSCDLPESCIKEDC